MSVHCVPLCVCVCPCVLCPFSVSMFSFLCFIPLPPLPHPLRCVSLAWCCVCLPVFRLISSVSCQSYVFMSVCTCHFLSYSVMCVMFGFASSVSLCLISCVSLLFLYPCYSLCKSCVSLCPGISLIPGCVLCLLV